MDCQQLWWRWWVGRLGGAGRGGEKAREAVEKVREHAREWGRWWRVEVAQRQWCVLPAPPMKPSSPLRQWCSALVLRIAESGPPHTTRIFVLSAPLKRPLCNGMDSRCRIPYCAEADRKELWGMRLGTVKSRSHPKSFCGRFVGTVVPHLLIMELVRCVYDLSMKAPAWIIFVLTLTTFLSVFS
jgi:hypothetical protein